MPNPRQHSTSGRGSTLSQSGPPGGESRRAEGSVDLKNRTAGRVAWALALVALALSVGSVVFGAKNGANPWSFNGASAEVLVGVFGGLGALLASRRPANPIGWIFVATSLLFGVGGLTDQYARYAFVTSNRSLPAAAIAAWIARWIWVPGTGFLVVFPLLLFPDGRPPSPRWRPVAWVGAVAIAVATVPVAVEGWSLRGPRLLYANEPPRSLPHAFRVAVAVEESLFFLIFLLAFVGAFSLLIRLRRAS